ncbi:histidinol-phosphatase [Actinoplanes philippinensis]|nr:histidinol-phosphatase [Actinoplanes philippinensis]
MLPADGHVHTEWSWDCEPGDMEASCARAIRVGLPAVAFTEHLDFTVWTGVEPAPDAPAKVTGLITEDGTLTPPLLDVEGYLACVRRCRERHPGLLILTGVEVGEPHWHRDQVAAVLAAGRFDRVLGSLHTLPLGAGLNEPGEHFARRPAAEVVRDYLAEIPRLVDGFPDFEVLAHIDYVSRFWPGSAGPFRPGDFEEEFRHALRTVADAGRVLEVNTNRRPFPEIVRWWRESGGAVVTFGSDAHHPGGVGDGFAHAVAVVEAMGFRPGRHPYDRWHR